MHHAHAKGIIHRDLKPANILVAIDPQTGEPSPKILDFGVARATDADVQSATMQTEVGQIIGTLPHMSPEQVAGDPGDIDTRSDVYALGVVLYELLAGKIPYDIERALIVEAARIIREDEPSRLSAINTRLRGDIETIVAKALEKTRDRRYQSAIDLGSDIRRYLSNEPITARPPSTWYQFTKFARRNRALVAGFGAAVAALLIGLAGTTYGLVEANTQRGLAVERAEEAELARQEEADRAAELEAVSGFQSDQIAALDASLMGATIRSGLLERVGERDALLGLDEDRAAANRLAAEQALQGVDFTGLSSDALRAHVIDRSVEAINTQFDDEAGIRARLLWALGETTTELAYYDLAAELLGQSADLFEESIGPDDHKTLVARSDYATALMFRDGDSDEIRETLRDVVGRLAEVLGPEHEDTLTAKANIGIAHYHAGSYVDAEAVLGEVVASSIAANNGPSPDTVGIMTMWGVALSYLGRHEEAVSALERAYQAGQDLLGSEDPRTMLARGNLGFALFEAGDFDRSEQLLREDVRMTQAVYGRKHPESMASVLNLAHVLDTLGKPQESDRYFLEANKLRAEVLGPTHPRTIQSREVYASVLIGRGEVQWGLGIYEENVQRLRDSLGGDHADVLEQMNLLGIDYVKNDLLEQSYEIFTETLARRERVLGEDHPDTLITVNNVGLALRRLERFDEALVFYERGLAGRRRVLGDSHPATLITINNLGRFNHEIGEYDVAEGYYREAMTTHETEYGELDQGTLRAKSNLGVLYLDQGRFADAETWLAETLAGRIASSGEAAELTIITYRSLVRLYTEWHANEPAAGHDQTAERYQAKLDAALAAQ